MDIIKQWVEIVFKLLHKGYDSLTKEEIKNLDTYFGWKVKTTLRGKKLMCIIPEGEAGWFHIVDDLRGMMIMYVLEKREQLINLEPNLLWKKFNNHAYRYLQYKYWQKSMRETQFQVGDATQRGKDYSGEELEERYVDLSDIPPQILDLPDDILKDEDEDEKRQSSKITVTTFNKNGKVKKVKKVKPKKEDQKEEDEFIPETEEEFVPETEEEKEFFKPEEKPEDDYYDEE